jgi:hypothetical protein
MAKYQYDGESELYFPSLGLTVNQGDIFEAPEGLTALGVTPVTKSKNTTATEESEASE